ncbi:uncharacterized protein LOC130086183 [Rhinichthys klamathensis goyatoka]|uniref:uncharacterized protein LOC130086183 n=1 Tax=Rhinichthys klamathensis goyatoka TaxID=3034132 RepID=UPI0024B49388|nr:uncharacterized protein LOC130086183 [Rhinichthys klamathensis goyatoka]
MYIARGLLILSFGSMLRLISCYSDGSFLEEGQCQAMNIIHLDRSGVQISAQNTEAPFKVEPENVTVSEGNTGRITVTLSGGSSQFEGFMLDSRECDNCPSVGTFSLDDLDNSQLICGGSVVVHINNLKKNSIRVFWTHTAAASRLFFFRAAVVEDFFKFWRRKKINVPSTTPLPSETSAHTRLTTSPTIFPTDSHATGTSTAPPISEANSTQTNLTTSTTTFTTSNIDSQATVTSTSPSQCAQYMRCVLALLLFSRLCFLGGSSLLIIIRPVLEKTTTMSASVLELASKTIAVILVLIKANKYECVYECAGFRFTALTVAAMVSSLLHTITVLLHCGPSHELRKCWLYAIVMVDLMNTTITTTAIFVGTWCFKECWLPILMGVYVVWEIMLYLGSVCYEHTEKYQTRKRVRKNQNHILEKRISPWLLMFIIFTILNVSLTAALITGVSLVRMIN